MFFQAVITNIRNMWVLMHLHVSDVFLKSGIIHLSIDGTTIMITKNNNTWYYVDNNIFMLVGCTEH